MTGFWIGCAIGAVIGGTAGIHRDIVRARAARLLRRADRTIN
ncbi:MAG: hypothetical protein WAL84_02310 [Candidatus Dormiibacterota bacterium]